MEFFHGTSKPYVRWWWLSGPFTHWDITRQLEWIRDNGFGGVELAWIYPTWLEDDADARPTFLGPEWSELVAFTKSETERLGLGCDFTFGSAWPFAGSWLKDNDIAQTFDGPSDQRVGGSWEGPVPVLNHLSAAALERYAEPLFAALKDALKGSPSALFCDSLEIATEHLWSPGLPHLDDRYEYRKLISQTILREFYEPFTRLANEHGAYSRVQCHGAPTDLLAAYSAADVPESEALLFPPSFSRIAASAAAWVGKPVVSAEAFTCLYGFPDEHLGEEKIGDLKLLADALFANGVNQIVWHGMLYQPAGQSVRFYASVHVGPDSPFASELPAFNRYLETISSHLKQGRAYGGLGVYLCNEDALKLDRIPENQRTPGANYVWEMRYAVPTAELAGFHPLWISLPFLREATVIDRQIRSCELTVQALYIDCEWLEPDALAELQRLESSGGKLFWKTRPQLQPLLEGERIPPYWARVIDEDLLLFFAHPAAARITYPMPYGLSTDDQTCDVIVHWAGQDIPLSLRFKIAQSQMCRISGVNCAVTWIPLSS
ncbi:MAG: hypothetical protein M3Y24_05650 [Acidobacteriota bacterium]|nr:hypothetical protein [Acidobacteriota bacterium]